MKFESAKINDIEGLGFAVMSLSENLKKYSGTFIPKDISKVLELMLLTENPIFTGKVIKGSKKSICTFPIHIISSNNSEVKFLAKRDPHI